MSIVIAVNKAVSYENLNVVKYFIRDSWELQKVTMLYKPSFGLPDEESINDYPCSIFFKDKKTGEDIIMRIYSFTCGYGGEGPNDFISLLDYLRIKYEEDDIITKRKMDSSGWIYLIFKP